LHGNKIQFNLNKIKFNIKKINSSLSLHASAIVDISVL